MNTQNVRNKKYRSALNDVVRVRELSIRSYFPDKSIIVLIRRNLAFSHFKTIRPNKTVGNNYAF